LAIVAAIVPVVLLLFGNSRAGIISVMVKAVVIVDRPALLIGFRNPEPFKVGLHFPQMQGTLGPSPFIDHLGDGLKGWSVATTVTGTKPTANEEIAVDELVEEGWNQESAAVLGVAENRRRQNNQGLEATIAGAAQGRGPNDVAVVLSAGFVRPVPHDTLTQATVEEDLVGGREDAFERVVVQWILGVGPGVDDAPEDTLVLGIRKPAAEVGYMVPDTLFRLLVLQQLGPGAPLRRVGSDGMSGGCPFHGAGGGLRGWKPVRGRKVVATRVGVSMRGMVALGSTGSEDVVVMANMVMIVLD
jgi:hypothetical protein